MSLALLERPATNIAATTCTCGHHTQAEELLNMMSDSTIVRVMGLESIDAFLYLFRTFPNFSSTAVALVVDEIQKEKDNG